MISYAPFWQTLERKGLSTYDLLFKYGLSANTIHRMKNGRAITTKTLNELCLMLDCTVSDIIEFIKTDDD